MGFSSGLFSLLYNWNTDKTNGVKITASRMQAQDEDIASGLSKAILKDGTQTITANIPFNTFKITGLGDASAAKDAMNRDASDARYMPIAGAATYQLTEGASPGTPSSGFGKAWLDTSGVFNFINDGGTNIKLVDATEVLVSTGTAAAAATLDLTLPATYTHFRLVLSDIEPVSAATINSRISFDSGVSYKSDALYYVAGIRQDQGAATLSNIGGATQDTIVLTPSLPIAAGHGNIIEMSFHTQSTGSHLSGGVWRQQSWQSAGSLSNVSGAWGYRGASTRATNIRIYASTGNISFVRYSLYAGR
jgi:hypothetical protein